MNSTRTFYALLLGAFALIGIFVAMNALAEHDNVIGTIEALLGALIATIAAAAWHIGSVLDEHFERIWPKPPKPQRIQPHAQQPPQGPGQ